MTAIPRTVHRIWFGPHKMRDELEFYGRTWENFGYEVVLWTESDLPDLVNQDDYDDLFVHGVNAGGGDPALGLWVQRADIVAYELAWRYGGIVANCDMECVRDLDPLLEGVEAFAGHETETYLCNALIGCTPFHPFFGRVITRLPGWRAEHPGEAMNVQTGPSLLTQVWRENPELGLVDLDRSAFYPFSYLEMDREWDVHPEAWAIHHWGHTRGRWSKIPVG